MNSKNLLKNIKDNPTSFEKSVARERAQKEEALSNKFKDQKRNELVFKKEVLNRVRFEHAAQKEESLNSKFITKLTIPAESDVVFSVELKSKSTTKTKKRENPGRPKKGEKDRFTKKSITLDPDTMSLVRSKRGEGKVNKKTGKLEFQEDSQNIRYLIEMGGRYERLIKDQSKVLKDLLVVFKKHLNKAKVKKVGVGASDIVYDFEDNLDSINECHIQSLKIENFLKITGLFQYDYFLKQYKASIVLGEKARFNRLGGLNPYLSTLLTHEELKLLNIAAFSDSFLTTSRLSELHQ